LNVNEISFDNLTVFVRPFSIFPNDAIILFLKIKSTLTPLLSSERWLSWINGKKVDIIENHQEIFELSELTKDFLFMIESVETREYLLNESNKEITEKNQDLIKALTDVQTIQAKLIQQEKLAGIGQLAAGVAHELNNPIGFVSGNFTALNKYFIIITNFFKFLDKRLSNKDEKDEHSTLTINELKSIIEEYKEENNFEFILSDINDLFEESEDGLDRVSKIVSNLRTFSRIDSVNKHERYNLNEGIKSTLSVAKNEYKYISVIELDLNHDLPIIETNASEINQVLLNIIINAAQSFKSKSDIEENIIKIKTFSNDSHIICEISDTGSGIEDKYINKIFEPFFTTKEIGKGTGLGLNISYDIIVNKNKGLLDVETVLGKGTTFVIKLPCKL